MHTRSDLQISPEQNRRREGWKWFFLPAVLALLSGFIFLGAHRQSLQGPNEGEEGEHPQITNIVRFHTTYGDFDLALYGKDAPKTVANIVALVDSGFYDGLLFHRVYPEFFVQTGCQKTRDTALRSEWGTGGQSIYGSPYIDELDPNAPSFRIGYRRGVAAMANRGKPNTNTSQFFILLNDVSNKMPKRFTIFGKVNSGMDVVDRIGKAQLVDVGEFGGIPALPIRIDSARFVSVE